MTADDLIRELEEAQAELAEAASEPMPLDEAARLMSEGHILND